jgi:hypothetical protein
LTTSYILQFIWVQRQKGNAIRCLSHAVVAILTEAEETIVRGVCDYLTERKLEMTTNIEPTAATGGDLTGLLDTLKVVADQYGYAEYAEDCPTLAAHGIKRAALAP